MRCRLAGRLPSSGAFVLRWQRRISYSTETELALGDADARTESTEPVGSVTVGKKKGKKMGEKVRIGQRLWYDREAVAAAQYSSLSRE